MLLRILVRINPSLYRCAPINGITVSPCKAGLSSENLGAQYTDTHVERSCYCQLQSLKEILLISTQAPRTPLALHTFVVVTIVTELLFIVFCFL